MLELNTTVFVKGKIVGVEIDRITGNLKYKIDVVNHDCWDRPERVELEATGIDKLFVTIND